MYGFNHPFHARRARYGTAGLVRFGVHDANSQRHSGGEDDDGDVSGADGAVADGCSGRGKLPGMGVVLAVTLLLTDLGNCMF